MNKILKIQNLTKNFGNVSAVSNINLEVEEGTIHSIIGPNGAGKSTFFNMISGVIPPSEGNVYYKDKDITGFESFSRREDSHKKKNLKIKSSLVSCLTN